jgi:hypothetical protein
MLKCNVTSNLYSSFTVTDHVSQWNEKNWQTFSFSEVDRIYYYADIWL